MFSENLVNKSVGLESIGGQVHLYAGAQCYMRMPTTRNTYCAEHGSGLIRHLETLKQISAPKQINDV